jgi:hypothetical protein
MRAGDVFRQCMLDLDVETARRCWADIAPQMPQPKSDAETLVTLHLARTQTEAVPSHKRVYSHHWLLDHGYPSMLPAHMQPKAERPRKVEAVGVAVLALREEGRPRAKAIEKAMSDAVLECYADGVTDTDAIKARMAEARRKIDR